MSLAYPLINRKVFDSQDGLEYFPLPIHQRTAQEEAAAKFAKKNSGKPRAVRLPGYNRERAEGATPLQIYEQVQGVTPAVSKYMEVKNARQLQRNLAVKMDQRQQQKAVVDDYFYNVGNEIAKQQKLKLELAGMDTALANELIGRQAQEQASLASQLQGPPNPFRLASGESAQAQAVNGIMDALSQATPDSFSMSGSVAPTMTSSELFNTAYEDFELAEMEQRAQEQAGRELISDIDDTRGGMEIPLDMQKTAAANQLRNAINQKPKLRQDFQSAYRQNLPSSNQYIHVSQWDRTRENREAFIKTIADFQKELNDEVPIQFEQFRRVYSE